MTWSRTDDDSRFRTSSVARRSGLAGSRRRARWFFLAAAVALLGGACADERRPDWNVVLVVVDTLRADRLSLYGHERPTSPFLDELAGESVVFDNSRAQAACTFPSVNSLLTSRLPQSFLGQPEKRMGIPDSIPSLPEILQPLGYSTAAISGSLIVRKNPSRHNPHGGFDRGFEIFDETCRGKGANCVTGKAMELVAELGEPFLLYAHYMDPHAPYFPPESHERRFVSDTRVRKWAQQGRVWPIMHRLYKGKEGREFDERDVERLTELYDEEIRYFDGQLRLLVEELERSGRLERTLFVFVSDHGEELMDHQEQGHCRDLAWDTLLRTPMMIRFPGGQATGRRQWPVQNLDLVPTILDYLGVEAGGAELEGRSLRPVIADDRPVHRVIFGAQGKSRTMVLDGIKSIHELETGRVRIFDVVRDPGETVDLAESRPELVEQHRELLARWMASVEGDIGREESIRRAQEAEDLLEALGYL